MDDELDQLLIEEGLLEAPVGAAAATTAAVVTPPAGAASDEFDEIIGDDDEAAAREAEAQAAAAAAAEATGAPAAMSADIQNLVRQLAERSIREDVRREEFEAAAAAAAAAAVAPSPLFEAAALELTPEEQATYAASAPVIEKLVRRELAAYHERIRPAGVATIEELRQQVAGFQPQLAQSAEAAFSAALRSGVPDLDDRVKRPEWQKYLDQPVPFAGGISFRQALHSAVTQERNLPKALEIIRGFELPAKAAAAATVVAPGRPSGGAPASVAAAARKPSTPQKLKYSLFERASAMMAEGKMDPVKYQKIADRYMDAHDEGLVDYNA